MSFEQSLLHNFKAFPDWMQLPVNLKLLRFEGFSYPEEGTGAGDRAPILTGTRFDRTKNQPNKKVQCIREISGLAEFLSQDMQLYNIKYGNRIKQYTSSIQ